MMTRPRADTTGGDDTMAALMGQMMQMPLTISSLIVHAARHFGEVEIVSKRAEGDMHRTTWAATELRARKMAQALARLGCTAGDRVGTLAWNGYRHLEIYYGASGSQLVCHTINPRLFPEQIAWIANDAADKVLFFDLTFLPLIEKLAPAMKSVRHFVLMSDRAHMPAQAAIPNLLCHDELVEAETATTPGPRWTRTPHRASATPRAPPATPRARSTATARPCCTPMPRRSRCDGLLGARRDPAGGADVPRQCLGPAVLGRAGRRQAGLPGPHLDGKSLYELFENEKVTFSAGVPTVWLGLLTYMKTNG
jgi:fatty-acyl-CoA synthase